MNSLAVNGIGRSYSRLLNRLDKMAALSDSDRRLLAELPLTVTNLTAGSSLHHEEQPRCFLVVNGFVCGSKTLGGARRQIISIFVPGDLVGLNGLQLPQSHDHFSALGPVVIASLPYCALEDALTRSSELARAFWRESMIEAAILRERIASLGRREALARVAHLICELVVRLQAVGLAQEEEIAICWTQIDVADTCGISAVHANRIVQELRRLEVVEWSPKRLKVRDCWNALVGIAAFTHDYLSGRELQEATTSR